MSHVHFLDPIDYISGKISRKFRTVYLRRKTSDRRFTQVRSARNTPLKPREVAVRQRFQAVRAMVAAIKPLIFCPKYGVLYTNGRFFCC